MTHRPLLATLLVLASAAVAQTVAAAAPPERGLCVRCTPIRAIDGDTIEVEVATTVRVRLWNCWCAESRTTDPVEKKLGLKAKEAMQVAIAGKPKATLFIPSQDARSLLDVTTLGRVLGEVWIEDFDESLSEMMVRAGHASTVKGGDLGR